MGERGDVGEAVLVDADVDERAERGDVGDDALERHTRPEVLQLLDAILEAGGAEGGPRVAARLVQLGEDVGDGGQSEPVVDEGLRAEPVQHSRVADELTQLEAGLGEDAPDHGVGLGVDRRGVQRVVTVGDAEEAGGLLEGLGAEARDRLERRPRPERAVGVPVRDDAVREPGGDAGDASKERSRGGVDVDTHGVDAVLDHGVEGPGQGRL